MPKDQRIYITVHDGMPEHPKVEGLSDAAFRLLVTCWCWCSRNLTDGAIPTAAWLKKGSAKARRELLDAGLVEVSPDSVTMHDYLDHQRSAVEVAELRSKRSDAGRQGGLATQARARASAQANGKQVPRQTRSKREADTDTEESSSELSARDADFEAWWSLYPRKVGKGQARKAYASALKKTTTDELADAAEVFAARVHDSGTEERFVPHPATWLNGERWTDAAPPPVAGPAVMVAANGTQQEVTW